MNIYRLRKNQKTYYQNIHSVFCPILNERVYFTTNGFNHLIYKKNHKARRISEQYLKLSYLKYATKVLGNCTEISDTRQISREIKGKLKQVIWLEFVYEVKRDAKIRVIVEKIGTGGYKFLSIMPHDKKSQKNLCRKRKK